METPIHNWPGEPLARERARFEGESTGWIQWKGTNVCMDVHCVCGYHGHVDDSFVYFYKCLGCGQRYSVGQSVVLFPIADDCAGAPKADSSDYRVDQALEVPQ